MFAVRGRTTALSGWNIIDRQNASRYNRTWWSLYTLQTVEHAYSMMSVSEPQRKASKRKQSARHATRARAPWMCKATPTPSCVSCCHHPRHALLSCHRNVPSPYFMASVVRQTVISFNRPCSLTQRAPSMHVVNASWFHSVIPSTS